MIKEQLKILGWTVYRFGKIAGIPESTAYALANAEQASTSSVKLAEKWLDSEIRIAELEALSK